MWFKGTPVDLKAFATYGTIRQTHPCRPYYTNNTLVQYFEVHLSHIGSGDTVVTIVIKVEKFEIISTSTVSWIRTRRIQRRRLTIISDFSKTVVTMGWWTKMPALCSSLCTLRPMYAWLDSGGGGGVIGAHCGPHARARARASAEHRFTRVGPTVDSYNPPPPHLYPYIQSSIHGP